MTVPALVAMCDDAYPHALAEIIVRKCDSRDAARSLLPLEYL